MFAAAAGLVGLVVFSAPAPECFGRNGIRCTVPFLLSEHTAHHFFAFTKRIYFGVIKKINSVIICDSHEFICYFIVYLFTETYPAAKGKYAYLQTRMSETTIFHNNNGLR